MVSIDPQRPKYLELVHRPIFMIKWFASVFMRLRLVHKYRKTGSGDTRRGPRGDTGGHLCVNTWSGHLDSVVGTINQFLIKTLGFCILSDRIWVKLQWSSIICGRQRCLLQENNFINISTGLCFQILRRLEWNIDIFLKYFDWFESFIYIQIL